MGTLIVIVVVLLAVITAGSIIFIAWELTSRETQDALERSLGRETERPVSAGSDDKDVQAPSPPGQGPDDDGRG